MDINEVVTTQQGAQHTSNGQPADEPTKAKAAPDETVGAPDQPAEKIEQAPDPRTEAMNRIRERVIAERNGQEQPEGDETPEGNPTDETPEGEPSEAPTSQLPLVERDGKFYARVKVYGEEKEIPYEDVVGTAQKNWAAEAQLRRVKEAWHTIQSERAKLEAERAELAANTNTAPPDTSDQNQDDDSEVQSVVDAIYAGDEEAARKALAGFKKTLQGGKKGLDVDPDAIAKQAAQGVLQELQQRAYKTSLKEGLETFKKEYPDIWGDERLVNLVDQETTRIQAEEPDLPPNKVMLEAGKRVRSWFGEKTTPGAGSDRQERKARAGSPVRSLNQAAQTAPPPAKRRTRQDVIADLKKSRGQA